MLLLDETQRTEEIWQVSLTSLFFKLIFMFKPFWKLFGFFLFFLWKPVFSFCMHKERLQQLGEGSAKVPFLRPLSCTVGELHPASVI